MITITNILDCEKFLLDTEAVIFDLDDTLYSEKDYVRSGYHAVADVFPQVEAMEEKLWTAFENGLPAIDTVLEKERLCSVEMKEKALAAYRNHAPTIELYIGVEAMLQRLQHCKKLGLITDGRPEGQWAKIEALRLAQYFEKIVVTDELGGPEFRKPNEAAYRLMQRELNVPFGKMAYIGDNMKKDFIAPSKMGMRSIYFKNGNGLYSG